MEQVILKTLEERLAKTLEVVARDLASVRTGRAKSSLVEDVKVEAYGGLMAVKELATINIPDPSLIVITPWDKSLVGAINTALQKAELNINPVIDGEAIKLAIPALTEERRRELVKVVHQKIESGRVMVRQVRSEIKSDLEAQKGEAGVSEDDVELWLKQMQDKVNQAMKDLDEMADKKEQELMTI